MGLRRRELDEFLAQHQWDLVTVTKQGKPLVRIDPLEPGKPLVRIDPLEPEMMTIRERREVYMATHGDDEKDDADFEIPARSTDVSGVEVED